MHRQTWLEETETPTSIPQRTLADAALALSIVICLLLVLQHFQVLELYGARLTADSPAAVKVYAIAGVPICFISLTLLAAVASAWISLRTSGVSTFLRWMTRIAAMLAVAYGVALAMNQIFCPYALTVCVTMFAFWILLERSHASPRFMPSAVVASCAGAGLVTSFLYLGVAEQNRARAVEREAARVSASVEKQMQDLRPTAITQNSELDSALPDVQQSPAPQRAPFRFGSPDAATRVVVFFDYESPECRRIDEGLRALLRKHPDRLSVTIRHFPHCSECNLSATSNEHPQACKWAKLVEAVHQVRGPEGSHKMHAWLLQQSDQVRQDKWRQQLRDVGITDEDEFSSVMESKNVLSAIFADVVEAKAIGVTKSPTLFVNGRQVRGFFPEARISQILESSKLPSAPDAVAKTIDDALVKTDEVPLQVQRQAVLNTVRIHSSSQRASGSGIIVATRRPFVYVLTAQHVVGQSPKVTLETFSAESYPDHDAQYSATVISTSPVADLAIVRYATVDTPFSPIRLATTDVPGAAGSRVFSVGCDQQGPPTCVVDEIVRSSRIRRDLSSKRPVQMWQLRKETVVGRSGGPLITPNGRLIGISSGISQGRGYFCHIEEIHQFLRENGLQFDIPIDDSSTP